MFYRHENDVINISEIVGMGKSFLFKEKKYIIIVNTTVGPMSMQFDDEKVRDKEFDDIWKKMEKMD